MVKRGRGKFERELFTFFSAMISGMIIAIFSLMIWTMLGSQVYMFSLLSPSGPEVYILGIRVKHWLIGLASMAIGGILYLRRSYILSGLLIGFGLILFLDELITRDLYYWS